MMAPTIKEIAMPFRITGLSPDAFRPLFGLSDPELAAKGARRYIADSKPGFPDRVEMRDAEPGESLLLLNYTHQPADTPYRASHAIFVIEGAKERYDQIDTVPAVMRSRTLSLRGFNKDNFLVAADLAEGVSLESAIDRFFADSNVAYIHAHYAKPGCYAARIDRLS
jgi:uncharacterized protein DUF1203